VHDADLQVLPIVNGLKLLSVAVCGVVSDSPQRLNSSVTAMTIFFRKVTNNENHVLYKLLPKKLRMTTT